MDTTDFYKWDGRYIKAFYDVQLPDGEIVKCWPNAGSMNALDGTDRKWKNSDDEILVRVSDEQEV